MTEQGPMARARQLIDEHQREFGELPHAARLARFINCEVCQTEGRILRNSGGPDDVDYGVCPACDGKREVEVECEPITIFDLENAEWY